MAQFYKIHESNIDWLNEQFKKLERKANKIKCVPPRWSTVQIQNEERVDLKGNLTGIIDTWHYVIVADTPEIKVNGWEYVGAIDHLETGNIVHRSPISQWLIPQEYRTSENYCGHCGYDRKRKTTYILRHEDSGTFKQVGSTCLADFLESKSVQHVAKLAELIHFIGQTFTSQPAPPSEPIRIKTEMFLVACAAEIRLNGWVSKSKSDMFTPATADVVWRQYTTYEITQPDRDLANAAFRWGRGINPKVGQDYLSNLRVICNEPLIEYRHIGIAASVIPAFLRDQKQTTLAQNSEFLGEVGDSVGPWTAKVTLVHQGVSKRKRPYTLIKFEDDRGNVGSWFAGKSTSIVQGKTYVVKGTISRTHTFNGVKETTLRGCNLTPA